ncbi:MAG: M23 family metallopeptidase [Nanoarchaeota archaeon]|nr:MAG: M23 family metallopeptidase [Nanoarchaeota archaeon]
MGLNKIIWTTLAAAWLIGVSQKDVRQIQISTPLEISRSFEPLVVPTSAPTPAISPSPTPRSLPLEYAAEFEWCKSRIIQYEKEQENFPAENISELRWPFIGNISTYFGKIVEQAGVPVYHDAIDIDAYRYYGAHVVAAADGVVYKTAMDDFGYGYHVIIDNGNFFTLYAHFSDIYVEQGQNVKAGEAIGAIGSTGYSTGPHLHFEVIEKQKIVSDDEAQKLKHCGTLADLVDFGPEYVYLARCRVFTSGELRQYARVDPLRFLPIESK